uniref:Uncharacterized protein n=1 Tax=viral metagenome TaxID=1070528 RepID=A0A6C0HGX7_9ZZZZ
MEEATNSEPTREQNESQEGEHTELLPSTSTPPPKAAENAINQSIEIQIQSIPDAIDTPIEPLVGSPSLHVFSICPNISLFSLKCKSYIAMKINDQDTRQKFTVLLTLCMEFYRIVIGSLLLSFVPQKCGDHVCGITENLYAEGAYYIVYILNLMTLISFSLLYLVEVKRENRLITYLDVNTAKPTDAVSVAISLRALPEIKRENILFMDKIYQQIGCCAISVYVFNTIISAIVIYGNYLDNKTVTAFLTNVLFMGSKVSEVYSIANTENNIFFSAYLKNKVQYNDVDPDKIPDEEIGQNIDSIEGSQDEY